MCAATVSASIEKRPAAVSIGCRSASLAPWRFTEMIVVPPSRAGIHGEASVMRPLGAVETQRVVGADRVPHETCARIPPGNVSVAAAYSSTPVAPSSPAPFTSMGSAKGWPCAAPAIRRAIDTG